MKTKLLFFAVFIAMVSCEKDDDTNTNDSKKKETVLTIKSASPTNEATIQANDAFSYELECLVSEEDYDGNATYELAVYLSGDGNSTYVDCGSKTITVTADVNQESKSDYNFDKPFTLLHALAISVQDDRSGFEEGIAFTKYLIDKGANLDKTTQFNTDIFPSGATALNIASCMNSWSVCELLIEKGASLTGLQNHLQNVVNNYNNEEAKKILKKITNLNNR